MEGSKSLGNVWEWCLNKSVHPEITIPDTSGDNRVLRGGSWVGSTISASADYRVGKSPGDRYVSRGFRVLSSVPLLTAESLTAVTAPIAAVDILPMEFPQHRSTQSPGVGKTYVVDPTLYAGIEFSETYFSCSQGIKAFSIVFFCCIPLSAI